MVILKSSIKKIVALLLMLTMVLTVVPCVASATGSTGDPVINSGATGSIIVTKYATANSSRPGNAGTGMSGQTPPVGAGYTTLNGAKFVLYKIADAAAVMGYYNGTNNTQYDLALFDYNRETKVATYKYDGTTSTTLTKVAEGTTAGSGTYTFTGLEVGIYALVEDTAPDQITVPLAENSLISIPMVNTATSNNNGNAAWMYDVYVYPKNHESTGTVELTKVDQNNAPLENVVFELYKKEFDSVGHLPMGEDTWVKVEKTVSNNGTESNLSGDATDATLKTGTNGILTLANLPANLYGTQYKLVEVYKAGTSPEGYIINTKPLYFQVLPNNTIRWNTNSDELKNENDGVVPTPTVSGTTLSITLKNERPSLTKEVKVNGQESYDTHAQYRMDETITYKLTVYVPANVTELETFTIVDTPEEGINDNASSVNVSYPNGGATINLTRGTDFTALETTTSNKGTGFTLTFADNIKSNIAGKTITITYNAKLTDKAVIAGDGNENTATLSYSKIANDLDVQDDTYDIIDHARVYTYQYKVTKQLKDATTESPAGVEFQLLDSDKSTLIDVVALNVVGGVDQGGSYRLALVGETGIDTMKTGTDGTLIIQGLKSQDYYLKETKTVGGYNLLSEPFPITVSVAETTTWTPGNWQNGTAFTDTGKVVKSYDSTTYKDANNQPFTSNDPTGTSTIINKKGFVLPQTGGMGYLLFCAVGIALIGGGAALIFGGRKKKIR